MAIQAQMCQDENWVLGDGNGFNNGYNDLFFNLQQKQQQQEFRIWENQNQNQTLFENTNNNGVFLQNKFFQQSQEIDQFVRYQSERLRLGILEQRNRQLAAVMRRMESTVQIALAQKDHEIATAARRTAELESLLTRLEAENHTWQRVARENEAVVVSLNNTLEQLKEQGRCSAAAPDDAESCCGGGGERPEMTTRRV